MENKELEDIKKEVAFRYMGIMIVLTIISFLPTFLLFNIIVEQYYIWVVYSSLALTCVGLRITPWVYRKIFRK